MTQAREANLQRLLDIAKEENSTNPIRSLDHLYFDKSAQVCADNEFSNVRTNMYLSPAAVPFSVKEGMSKSDETGLRVFGAAAIRKVGVLLEIPNDAIVIAQSIFQRFYFQVSFLAYDLKEVCAASLLLSCKLTDLQRFMRKIIQAFHICFKLDALYLDQNSETFKKAKNAIIDMEVSILYELGYEIQRLANSPHKFLLFFTKTLKCEKELCQTAWNFANDAYLGCASLFYPPELLAAAAIYLAYKATTLPMIRLPWWVLSEYSFELVSEAAKAIYDVGCVPVSSILECKKTLEAAAAKAKTKDYSFEPNFDLMYKLTDRQILNRALDRISKHRESRSREVEKPDPRESDRRKKRDKSKTRRSRSKEARRSKHKSRKDSKSRSKHKRPDKSKRRRRGSSSSDRYSRVTQIPDFGDSRPKAEETGEGAEERQGGRQARAQKLEPQLPRSDRRLRQEERGEAGVARAAAP